MKPTRKWFVQTTDADPVYPDPTVGLVAKVWGRGTTSHAAVAVHAAVAGSASMITTASTSTTLAAVPTMLAVAVQASGLTLQVAVKAADFVASIGVNTAIGATWSAYGNLASVEYALSYLGVANVRDVYRNSDDVYRFQQLASQLGVRFDFHLDSVPNGVAWEIAQILANPNLVKLVEGPNETDATQLVYNSFTGLAAAYAEQAALFNAVKNDPVLTSATRTTPVIQASFAQIASFSATGDWSAVSNYGNSHQYFSGGLPPGSNVATYVSLAQQTSPGQQVIATEAGYYSLPSDTGVDTLVQAKYDLTLLFDDWQAGIPLTYLFELLDESTDSAGTDPASHFGLFTAAGVAKIAATALHNLVALLTDNGTSTGTASLAYSISGLPSSGHSLLMSKANGDFVVAIWNDAQLWNAATASAVTVAPVPITLSLGQAFARIAVYDPLAGTTATSSYVNASQVALNALDHPILVTISATAQPQLALVQPVVTELVQAGQPTANLWADVLASVLESNSAYVSGLTIQSVNTTGVMGTLTLNSATKSLVYTAAAYNPNDTVDTITYTVTDSHGGTVTGTLHIVVAPPVLTIYGMQPGGEYAAPGAGWTLYSEAAGQTLIGSAAGKVTFVGLGDTTMAAYGTGNVIIGATGNHVVATGSGNAKVTLAAGNNQIFGGGSGDVIVSGDGNTIVMGQTGSTRVTLGNGNHSVGLTGSGNTISIGTGISVISAGDGGSETVTVTGGNNQISVGGANNVVHVLGGTNSIGSTGSKSAFALDAGSNSVYATGSGNTITGGNSNNTITGSTGTTAVTLGNGNNQIQLSGAGNTIKLGTGTNVVDAGNGGTETVTVAGGNNQIFLGGASNAVTLTAGTNMVSATATQSSFTAVAGTNTIYVQGSGNTITGGSGNDTIIALSGGNTLTSGAGTEQIQFAGAGNVILVGKGATTLYDSGSGGTIRLAANPAATTQIYGAVMTNGDTFDLRALLASTTWGGSTSTLSGYLSFQMVGSDAVLRVNPTAAIGGATYAVAEFHSTGQLALSTFLSHAIVA